MVFGTLEVVLLAIYIIQLHQTVHRARRSLERSHGAIPQIKLAFMVDAFLRLRTFVCVLALLSTNYFVTLGLVSLAASLFWLTDYLPPGKSLFARAGDKLKGFVSRAAPAPSPA